MQSSLAVEVGTVYLVGNVDVSLIVQWLSRINKAKPKRLTNDGRIQAVTDTVNFKIVSNFIILIHVKLLS